MIVVSAGMQKAGSGWYFNLTNDLLVAAGHQDVRALRERYHLQAVLKHYNCNIGRPVLPRLMLLAIPHLMGHSFVVKTHSGPTSSLRFLMSRNMLRATYIYRDPRDAVVSAYHHGRKLRQSGETHSFARLESMEMAVLAAKRWLAIWDAWARQEGVLLTRYEDLLTDPVGETQRLCRFLSLDLPLEELHRISGTYRKDRAGDVKGLHLSKGVAGRYREVLSEEELAQCNAHFADYLPRMGYAAS